MKFNNLLSLLLLCNFLALVEQIEAEEKLETNNYNSEKLTKIKNEEEKHFELINKNNDPTSYFEEDSIEKYFDKKVTFDQYLSYSMRALKLIAGFDNDLHRYDSRAKLIDSFARNLSYADDLNNKKPRIDIKEVELLKDESELTLIENEQNQINCQTGLNYLIKESQKLFLNSDSFSKSKELNMIDFFDSFGSPMSQLTMGNLMWLGSHEQCLKSKLNIPSSKLETISTTKGRYCIANFRSLNWTLTKKSSIENPPSDGGNSIKIGICLPKSCNSISILRHGQLIEQLIKKVRLNQIPYNEYSMNHLYCLPDEESPLRQFSLSAMIFITLLSSWLTLILYISIKYEYLRMKSINLNKSTRLFDESIRENKLYDIFAFRICLNSLFNSSGQEKSFVSRSQVRIKANLLDDKKKTFEEDHQFNCNNKSITKNFDSFTKINSFQKNTNNNELTSPLSNNNEASSFNQQYSNKFVAKQKDLNLINSKEAFCVLNSLDSDKNKQAKLNKHLNDNNDKNDCVLVNNEKYKDFKHSSSVVSVINSSSNGIKIDDEERTIKQENSIKLSSIDGIKVLSMIWLIGAHTLLFFIRTISNGRQFWSILRDARFMTVMAGIFPVDTFFTITGILTAYLKLNKNDGVAMNRFNYWLEAFVHRYLRFMPMYIIIFWYTRDVSEYIGSGPLWDYATAETSLRSICKRESIMVPLLFKANFKPLDEHCVKPAWYLANDYQFLLITPIYMLLLMKSKILGYSFIGLSIIVSLITQFMTVFYSNDLSDFEVLINFKPMFGTYILKNLWKLYVLPYNRIPPYLIGISTGHLMYDLNKKYQTVDYSDNNNHRNLNNQKTLIKGLNKSQDSISSTSSCSSTTTRKTTTTTNSNHHNSTSEILKTNNDINHNRNYSLIRMLLSYNCINVWTPLVLLISIIYLPMITRFFTQEGLIAKLGTSSIIEIMRLLWSLAIARLIFVCSTNNLRKEITKISNYHNSFSKVDNDSFIIRLLSSEKWKPWSKIGLSALLIQWEIISYLAQIQTTAPNMTITFLISIILASILTTYLLALIIYLTIEYPLSQVERYYIHPILFGKV